MAMWLPINLSAVTDLDDQHTQHAVLTAADYSDIADAITPVVTQFGPTKHLPKALGSSNVATRSSI